MIRQRSKSLILWMAAMALLVMTAMTSRAETTDKFVPDTKINQISVGNLTVQEAQNKIRETYISEYKFSVIKKDGTKEDILGSEIGYSAEVTDSLQSFLDAQNANGRITGPAAGNSYEITVNGRYDEAVLITRIGSLACLAGGDVVKTQDARISDYLPGSPFVIIPEVEGSSLNPEKTTAAIKEAVSSGKRELNLSEAGCYETVQVRSTDEGLLKRLDILNHMGNMAITYRIRGQEEVLDGQTISNWITGFADGQFQVDRAQAAQYISQLAAKYDTAGTTRTFKTVSGNEVAVAGEYGWRLNQAAETDALVAMIRTVETQERVPEFTQSAASGENDWGSTYVEIDLTGQHVYMVRDGAVVWDAPCVTGNVSKNYTTPAGIYSLYYKERNKVLRGAKLADGSYEYESPVKYWMPFNGGIGLHDADWRSKFGGSIYQKSGSHGCVNLPQNKVPELYDLVYKGIPIICYN